MEVKATTEVLENQNYIKISREKYLDLTHYLNGIRAMKTTSQKDTMIYEINGSEIIFTNINGSSVKGLMPKKITLSEDAKKDELFKNQIKLILKKDLK